METPEIHTKLLDSGFLNSTCVWQCKDQKISIKIDKSKKAQQPGLSSRGRLSPSIVGFLDGSSPFCTEAVFIRMDSSTTLPLWAPSVLSPPHWFHASSHSCLWFLSFCACLKTLSKQIALISLQIPRGLLWIPRVSLSALLSLFLLPVLTLTGDSDFLGSHMEASLTFQG